MIANPPKAAKAYYEKLARYCGDPRRRPGQMCARPRRGLSPALFIKRVAGLGGDRLSLRHGRLYRNGHAVDEPYTAACDDRELCHFPRTITVPRGHYYLLGDNRGANFDSRAWGPVPRRGIVARVEKCTPQPAVGCDPRTP